MENSWIFGIVGLVGGGLVAWLWLRSRPTGSPEQSQQLSSLQAMHERLDRMGEAISQRLHENVEAMNESKSFLANRVSATERTVREVSSSLGRLAQATDALKTTTDEISNFQNLLKNPKVRGGFGEVLLANLLAEVLPQGWYEMQYVMASTGQAADAIVRLQDGYIVAIDAKFPLANYELYAHEQDPDRKRRAHSELMRDVKKHVTDISQKYIAPSDRTLDYAFMYIPMEGVYYETMIKSTGENSMWDFCLKHHVVPVSPNSILAYLRTVLIGLRGMKIEEQAREILTHLSQVRRDFKQFAEDYAMVGKHLVNAKNRYDDSTRRLDKFGNRLEQIEEQVPAAALPEPTAIEQEKIRV